MHHIYLASAPNQELHRVSSSWGLRLLSCIFSWTCCGTQSTHISLSDSLFTACCKFKNTVDDRMRWRPRHAWKIVSADTKEALSRTWGWKVAGVEVCTTAGAASPVWGCWLGCQDAVKIKGKTSWVPAFLTKYGPTLQVTALIGPSFIIIMRIPFLMCFFSPHVAELLFFSLDFFCLWNVLDKYAAEMACYWLCTFLVEWKVKKDSISHIKYSVNVI